MHEELQLVPSVMAMEMSSIHHLKVNKNEDCIVV